VQQTSTLAKLGFEPTAPDRWPSALSRDDFSAAFPEETQFVEFKQGLSDLQDSIVAFSNTHGGLILVGVRNNGALVGLDYKPTTEDRIQQAVQEIHSPGIVSVRPLRVGDRKVAVVGVGPLTEGFAQTSQARVLIRVGTRRVALIGNELVRFIHERATSSFETHATDVALDEADPELLAQVLNRLSISDTTQATRRLIERGLAIRDAGQDVMTVAGALYLLPRPATVLGRAYIEVMRFRNEGENPDRREEFDGALPLQVEQVRDFVMGELGAESVVVGLRRHELPRLPERVVREAIANAVAHRSYELRGMPVRVSMFPDRVEITSPGGLPAPVTVETMRDSFVARNNAVIRALRRYRLAEDSGKGVDLIEDLMRDELLEQPKFSATESSVTVKLPILSPTRPEERAWVREVVERGAIEDKDRVLLVHARRGEALTNQRARELLATGREGAMLALRRLVDAGLLVRSGKTAGTQYRLAESLGPPSGIRLTRPELMKIIINMARTGSVTNQAVRERTGLDRTDVLSLFEEMVASGRLVRVGQRRGTRYVLPGRPAKSRRG
jgi:ATP-dependent DNA helicase RecG